MRHPVAGVTVDGRTIAWLLAMPPLFLLHEGEEYRTMVPWIAEHSSLVPVAVRSIVPDNPALFAYAGILFMIIYATAALAAIRSKPQSLAWIVLAILIIARLENAVLHITESAMLTQYTPGVLTAVFLILPLGVYLMKQLLGLKLIRRSWLTGMIIAAFAVQSAGIAAILLFGKI